MLRYIIRRLLWVLVTLLLITLITYLIFFIMPPTKPEVNFAGSSPPRARRGGARAVRAGQPVIVQYGLFARRIFLGDEYGWPGSASPSPRGTP
jgi:peptide/nickel transport system permease protein